MGCPYIPRAYIYNLVSTPETQETNQERERNIYELEHQDGCCEIVPLVYDQAFHL